MKLVGAIALAAVVAAAAATGWARSTGRPSEPPVAAPPNPATAAPQAPTIDPNVSGVGGLNVRYLNSDGEIKHLDVKDFPR